VNSGGMVQLPLSSTAVSFSPSTRGTFSTRPPPVMCTMPLISTCSISASSGLT
jgi:hypothetical protein